MLCSSRPGRQKKRKDRSNVKKLRQLLDECDEETIKLVGFYIHGFGNTSCHSTHCTSISNEERDATAATFCARVESIHVTRLSSNSGR